MIHLEALSIIFEKGTVLEKRVLQKIDLIIPSGQFVTVIGSNGAGKSTLLKAIAGECLPDSGRIILGSSDVSRVKDVKRSKSVARVFQDPLMGTCGDLTVCENLALAYRRGKSHGLASASPKNLRDLFQRHLEKLNLGLENRLNSSMALLSGGQRQAISLLMATLSSSEVLLLDEHTAALDPKTAHIIMDMTQNLIQEQKITTLMVTHSLHQALSYGTRTLMLHEGRIIYDVSGSERSHLTIDDLLKKFGPSVQEDRLFF